MHRRLRVRFYLVKSNCRRLMYLPAPLLLLLLKQLGTMEMCIGEERRVSVPPRLGFGSRGSKAYGVPPDAALEYRVKLVSINMQTDPRARRADVDDEQRFYEGDDGRVFNAATASP